MENILKLYTYVDGVNDTPFPSEEEQVQIIDFKFDASRMAGAPTIEATVKHRLCLDNLWSDKVYASYRGEKYYVRNTPSSSKDNTDERYSHDVELMSERDVLNHVYFIDAVQGDSGIDKVKSNSPSVQFYGDIKEFVGRLNSSLEYAKLDYTAVIDDGIESEIVNVSFEDKYILEALQESVNIFEIPYYFVSKTIHFGYMENAIPYEMEYGNEGALLSISKENANYKAVNRVSGTGSTENIPYYYPNTSPNGDIYFEPIAGNTGITSSSDITVINPELFASKISVNDILTCFLFDAAITSNNAKSTIEGIEVVKIDEVVDLKINVSSSGYVSLNISYLPNIVIDSPLLFTYTSNPKVTLAGSSVDVLSFDSDTITFMAKEAGEYSVHFETTTTLITDKYMELKVTVDVSIKGLGFQLVKEGDNVEVYNENEIGLSFNKQPNSGDKIKQSVKALIPFSQTLMPPVYRETSGAERFYNAKNNTYETPVEGGYYNFENEYSDNNRKEIIVDFSEIKPSIVWMTNNEGLRIDMFSEFAFDKNDSDEYDSVNKEYIHPYFYGKLRKFDGDYGFNLFDHAQEGSTMTVSMTSGVCGACNFEIGVGEETGKNIIQVDENGDLIYDEDGKVKTGEPQEKQNDTRTNEVWIALKKDDTTYPSFKPMPNATGNLKPSAGDTFVLTGINMPQSYIEKAENDLKEAIIKYMWLNNTDKFNFSIKFSRIFLKEHPEILDKLNENARIVVKYNNSTYTFYVDNFSVNVNSSEPLPEIEVNLVDTLTIGKNSLQNALDSVKQDILSTIGGDDFLKQGLKYFIRKDVDDYANGKLKLKKGASFGSYEKGKKGSNIDEKGYSEFEEVTSREGIKSSNLLWGALGAGFGLVTKDSTGNSYLEIDKLLVRMKAVFNQLEIRELSYSGGNFIFSPAGMKCTRVVDTGNVYRCFFTADDGEVAVNNTFKVDDLVRMQEINIKPGVHEGVSNRYFWRRCVGVGDNYIDLSKTDRDTTSDDAPKAGDSLVTLGNKTQVDRQNAIVISVFGEGSPSFIQYQGINDYTLDGKAVTTISPNGNVFTGDFIMKSGNKVEDELDKTNQSVDQAIQDMADTINLVKELEQNVGNLQDQIDGVIQTWTGDEVPTLDNYPANEWTTDEERQKHIGDLYYDVNGKAYRFDFRDGVYQWKVITDTGLEEALRKLGEKKRIFTAQPTTDSEYDIGDLWVNATAGSYVNDILRCRVAKTKGQAFSLDHWELASRYTDDTKANEAMQSAEYAQAAADAAQAAADKAQNTANTAKTTADAANSELNKINSDGYISPSEKGALVQQQKDIQSEYADIISQAGKYGVSTASYTTAYNSANTALTKYTATSPTHIEVGADYANISAYYTARQTILDAISTAAKKVATDAQADADAAKEAAEQAKQDAAEAKAKADAAAADAEEANDRLNDWASDSVISPTEKQAIKNEQAQVRAEKNEIVADAGKYSIATTTYVNAFNAYDAVLTKYSASYPENITIGTDFNSTQTTYYSERTKILGLIADAAKKYVDDLNQEQEDNLNQYKTEVSSQFEKTDERISQSVTETKTYTDSAIGNIKVGSVNLIGKKMMLAWNEKNPNIAVWGQDADGVYLGINQGFLHDSFHLDGVAQDIFSNKIKYKQNTQYVFSVKWRLYSAMSYTGLIFYIYYTDGSYERIALGGSQTTIIRKDIVSNKDKSVQKIASSYGSSAYSSLIYAISLIEGNQIPTEIPEAVEDITGQSNVNLLDNGKVVEAVIYKKLPIILKPNTVYNISVKNIVSTAGDQTEFLALPVDKDGRTIAYTNLINNSNKNAIFITHNTFEEQKCYINLYAGPTYNSSWKATWNEVMIVEGFVPPSSYSPSAGDVQAEIDGVKGALEDLNTTIDTTFKDGIIEESEAKAIESNINLLNSEKADIDAQYTKLYANTYLTGTAKTNLSSAKSAYNTAHSNLINAINTAIADGKATEAEKNNVDSKFIAYSTALSTYKTRVEEANKAIQDTIKKVGDDAQATADLAQQAAEAAQESANAAKTAADTAQSTANTAKKTAEAANSELSKMNNDGYISPSEKSMLKQQQKDIQTEYNDIISQAGKYSIATSSYTTAYNSANSALTKYTAASPTHITVGSDYANISAYYTARQTILNSISTAAKKVAVGAQEAADKAQETVDNLQIGGINIIPKAVFKSSSKYATAEVQTETLFGQKVVKFTKLSTGQPALVASSLKLDPGQTYTASIYVKNGVANAAKDYGRLIFYNTQSLAYKVLTKPSSEWTQLSVTFTNSKNIESCSIYAYASPAVGDETYFSCMKVEVGNRATPGYSLSQDSLVTVAMEKTIAGINNEPGKVTVFATKQQYNDQQELISQLDSSITVQAGRIDSVVSDISGLNTRISQTESDIELKVDASGIISAINLSKEGVAIKGDIIEITGQTVFKDSNGNKVNIFGQGDKVLKINNGVFSVSETGLLTATNADIQGKITATSGKIGGFNIGTGAQYWLSSGGMGLSGGVLIFEDSERTVMVGSGPGESTAGSPKTCWLQIGSRSAQIADADSIALFASAQGEETSFKKNYAIYTDYGDIRFGQGRLMFKPYVWEYVQNGAIPVQNKTIIHVLGNTGSDNPCYLDRNNAIEGQVVIIVNRTTDHRLNIKGTLMGDHWIPDGSLGIFVYAADNKKWVPLRM